MLRTQRETMVGEAFRGYLHRNVTIGLLEYLLDPLSIAEGLSAKSRVRVLIFIYSSILVLLCTIEVHSIIIGTR